SGLLPPGRPARSEHSETASTLPLPVLRVRTQTAMGRTSSVHDGGPLCSPSKQRLPCTCECFWEQEVHAGCHASKAQGSTQVPHQAASQTAAGSDYQSPSPDDDSHGVADRIACG